MDGPYSSIAEATEDVKTKVNESATTVHPLASPMVEVVIPAWTAALSGFEARAVVDQVEAAHLEQIAELYTANERWLIEKARELEIGTLNEHDAAKVLFMCLVRDLQLRFASKQNLNPHKFAVLLGERYTIAS